MIAVTWEMLWELRSRSNKEIVVGDFKQVPVSKKAMPGGDSVWAIEYGKRPATKKWHWRLISAANGQTLSSSEANGIANKKDLLDTIQPIAKALGLTTLREYTVLP